MRLWTVHPKYLDAKGLTALWREALLAQKVLMGDTKGWKNPDAWRNHPQLDRFKGHSGPLVAIGAYLHHIHNVSRTGDYNFDHSKIYYPAWLEKHIVQIIVSKEWVDNEVKALLKKLYKRDGIKHNLLLNDFSRNRVELHPLFVTGDPE